MNPPFSIGQKVVVLKDIVSSHAGIKRTHLKKGEVVVVLGIARCCVHRIDIGKKSDPIGRCPQCYKDFSDGILWCDTSLFAPIQTQYADATSEILEKFPVTEGGEVDKILNPEKATA